MEELEKVKVAYVVVDKTLRDIISIANGAQNRENLYELTIKRDSLSDEQKEIQRAYHWTTEQNSDIYVYDGDISDRIRKIAYEKLTSGYTGDIYQAILTEVLDTKITSTVGVIKENDGGYRINTNHFFGEETKEKSGLVFSENKKELEEKLEKVKRKATYKADENQFVYLERFTVGLYYYGFRDMYNKIGRAIKKFLRENLSYCLVKNKSIIPKEYAERGEKGIEEWRTLRSSKNKNNSIEKRMAKQLAQDNKEYAHTVLAGVLDAITSNNWSWAIPNIVIDGRYNKAKKDKLISTVLDAKLAKDWLKVKDEETVKKIKEYWKKVLKDAYDAVDKYEAPEKKPQ